MSPILLLESLVVWGWAANSVIKSRREKSWLFKFFALFQVGRVAGGGRAHCPHLYDARLGTMAFVTSAALWAFSVAEMNFSLLSGMSGWWGALYMRVIFMSWMRGIPPARQICRDSWAWALLLWMGCLTVLWHCKGGRNDVLEHQANPSCDTNPLLLFVWGCEGHCLSAGLCPSPGVTAPFGDRFQQQNPSQGLSPCPGRDSITVCLFLFHVIAFPTFWSTRLCLDMALQNPHTRGCFIMLL